MEGRRPGQRIGKEKINACDIIFHCLYTIARTMEIEIEGEKKGPVPLHWTPGLGPDALHKSRSDIFICEDRPWTGLWAVAPRTEQGTGSRAAPEFSASLR